MAGLRERLHNAGLIGKSLPPGERAQAGALVVLSSWMVFIFGGFAFQKLSEHFDQVLPSAAKEPAEAAFVVVIAAAVVGSAVVVLGALLALPAFVRFLQAGGWHTVRNRVTIATAIWWGALAHFAPWFLTDSPPGSNGAMVTVNLVVAMSLMVLATLLGTAGSGRIVQNRDALAGRLTVCGGRTQ